MKLTFALILVSTMLVSAGVYSQNTRLSLNYKDIEIGELLQLIEKQTEFRFAYSRSSLDPREKVTIDVENENVEQILGTILNKNQLSYKILDRYIIISDKNAFTESMVSQQALTISGRVLDSSGAPLPGVTVVVKGSTKGTITDAQGNYSLAEVPGDATLVFSFVGMKTQEIPVGGKSTINVTLAESTIGIEEVVAIGYGTMKKIELTSAVSSVKAEDFRKGSITDAAQLIKGKVAGVNIVNPDANPTSTSQILLRGAGTLRSSTSPLVVIDGVPGSLNDVAPDDIESFDILKDGSAAAIYGTRGNNGVILITTKKVRGETPATIEYNGYVTTQSIAKRIEFMNAEQYNQLAAQGKEGAVPYGSSTDWQDEIFQTPVSHTHNVSLKGGNANTNYIMNVNYKALEGLIKESDDNVLNVRLEINHTMFNGKLKINGNLMGYDRNYKSDDFNNVYRQALIFNPTHAIKDADGNYTEHSITSNPVALLKETDAITKITNFRPFGTITLLPIKGLTVKALASRDVSNNIYGYAETSKHPNSIKNSRTGYATRNTSRSVESLLETTANYVRSFEKHSIVILGGYSYQENNYEYFSMNNFNFSSDFYSYNNMANGGALAEGTASMSSTKNTSKLVSYFARGNYNFADKYMLMASIRYEGSTKFGADHKWGAFPAVSLGWNIINESFMTSLKSTFNTLKIRGGFGVTGTAPNDNYVSLSRLTYGDRMLYNEEWLRAIYPSTNPNPDLRWEKKEETNIGLDFGLFDNRISGSVDWYKRTSKDLLWEYNVPSPPYLYTTILANAGTIENKGIEIQLNATPVQTSMIKWDTNLNFSTNRNNVVSLSNDKFVNASGYFYTGGLGDPFNTNDASHRVKEGDPLGNFFGYKSIDVDENGYWIIEGEDGEAKPYAEAQPEDRKVIGNGLPKWYLSWNNTIAYKQFDLNVIMRGAFDYQALNLAKLHYGVPAGLTRGNIMTTAYDNVYGKRPLADNQSLSWVSYFLEDGDYWKIDNITLGYTLNLKNSPIKNIRIYASGSNLVTFTSYSGIDPEVNSLGLTPGRDERERYPSTRSYTLGLSLKF